MRGWDALHERDCLRGVLGGGPALYDLQLHPLFQLPGIVLYQFGSMPALRLVVSVLFYNIDHLSELPDGVLPQWVHLCLVYLSLC